MVRRPIVAGLAVAAIGLTAACGSGSSSSSTATEPAATTRPAPLLLGRSA